MQVTLNDERVITPVTNRYESWSYECRDLRVDILPVSVSTRVQKLYQRRDPKTLYEDLKEDRMDREEESEERLGRQGR